MMRDKRLAIETIKELTIAPGESLLEALEARGISIRDLAAQTNLPLKHIQAIVDGKAAITQDMAIALANALGCSAQFWLSLQSNYDHALAEIEAYYV